MGISPLVAGGIIAVTAIGLTCFAIAYSFGIVHYCRVHWFNKRSRRDDIERQPASTAGTRSDSVEAATLNNALVGTNPQRDTTYGPQQKSR
ncbi:hypothetical protein F5Y18DRAFT_393919 [Xylariaceae sp. FL1019]|nr:hypothetical protein F5Y18DRAFT_393919 [Xylariaceae sp. FL1019]